MRKIIPLLILISTLGSAFGQNSAEIYRKIQRLNFLGSVLYVGAHPDDENTRMISYFSNHLHARTAYLSMTRGDGGQNLIGTELREGLGLIRTQELLEARKIDGGTQFFTSANDFGYSKHPDETLTIWDQKTVQEQVVDRIRAFKPDLIINRFNHRTPGTTHGHHTSSAMLSVNAFDLAADPSYKSTNEKPWQPKRLFFNTSWWFYGSQEKFEAANKQNLTSIDVGKFDPILGISNATIAAKSRSQHKSQGFGSTPTLGKELEYLELIKGASIQNNDPFEGIDTSWNRIKGGTKIGEKITQVFHDFDFSNPSKSLPQLVEIYQAIQNLEDDHWKTIKTQEIQELIVACGGWDVAFYTSEEYGTPNQNLNTQIRVVNPTAIDLFVDRFSVEKQSFEFGTRASKNEPVTQSITFRSPNQITVPYWLTNKGSLGMYHVENTNWIGLPETPTIHGTLTVKLFEVPIQLEIPLTYRTTDPIAGEVIQPYQILPELAVTLDEEVYLISEGSELKVTATVKNYAKTSVNGQLEIDIPKNWHIAPQSIPIKMETKGEEQRYEFLITIAENDTKKSIFPIVKTKQSTYDKKLTPIAYPHITKQYMLQAAEATVAKLDIRSSEKRVGYIEGAGDKIPEALRNIGIEVDEIAVAELTSEWLKNFNTVILGIRSFNVGDAWNFKDQMLWDFVASGGTVVVQYNTSRGIKTKNIGPYPIQLSRDRVTDEFAAVTLLDSKHPIFNTPNALTEKDFEGWVQERGLYFAGQWDANYTPLISLNDAGESPKKGALLVANYGEGKFIFTGLSLFRQLPAGVPGAYRLLANLISYH